MWKRKNIPDTGSETARDCFGMEIGIGDSVCFSYNGLLFRSVVTATVEKVVTGRGGRRTLVFRRDSIRVRRLRGLASHRNIRKGAASRKSGDCILIS